jgi:hypothetical protein
MNPDYRRYVDNEYKDHRVYMALAGVEKNGRLRSWLMLRVGITGSGSSTYLGINQAYLVLTSG